MNIRRLTRNLKLRIEKQKHALSNGKFLTHTRRDIDAYRFKPVCNIFDFIPNY